MSTCATMTPSSSFFDFAHKLPSIGAVIRGRAPVTCLSFHEGGDHLFVASEEDARLRLVDCIKGTSDRAATRYETNGIRIVEATHDKFSVLISGEGRTKINSISGSFSSSEGTFISPQHSVTYASVYDNTVLRTFSGHSSKVTNLSMSPVDDRFLSSSDDRSIRLWDIQQPGCIAMIPPIHNGISGATAPYACFDSTGLVFAVTTSLPGTSGNVLHLYDARKYENGPFSELKVESFHTENFLVGKGLMRQDTAKQLSTLEWTSLQFNASGSQILATTSRYAALLDGFTAQILQTFVLPSVDDEQQQPEPITACFTQDDSYILTGGCRDGSIQCWEASTGTLLQTLTGHVDGPVRAVACNPKRAMFVSSSINTALWI